MLLTLGVKREPTKRRCLWTGDTEEQIGHDTQREILQRGGDWWIAEQRQHLGVKKEEKWRGEREDTQEREYFKLLGSVIQGDGGSEKGIENAEL